MKGKEGNTGSLGEKNVRKKEKTQFPEGNGSVVSQPILSDSLKKPERMLTNTEKVAVLESGVSKSDLERLKLTAGLDYDQMAQVLAVARATLINKKGQEKFNPMLSEKIIAIAEIFSRGYEVFENAASFNSWIMNNNRALGGKAPFDLLHSGFGRDEVKNLIGRIEHGVYS